MLIALAGRKGTGKTTLSNELLNREFKKISFADKLKELLSQIYEWDIQDLNNQEKKEEILETPAPWNKETSTKLANLIQHEGDILGEERIFRTRREAMQFIGTEVLRERVNQDFHINEFAKKVNKNENYVNDDLRFPNELEIVNQIGGIPVYIIRPYHFEFSNHASETSVKRIDFRHVLVNDESLDSLIDRFNCFLEAILTKKEIPILSTTSMKLNHNAFASKNEKTDKWANFLDNHAKLVKENNKITIEVSSNNYEEISEFKNFIGLKGEITRYKYGNFSVDVDSNYVVDDLKLWNLGFLK